MQMSKDAELVWPIFSHYHNLQALAPFWRCIALYARRHPLYLAIVCYLMSETLEWDCPGRQSGAYLPLFISQPSATRYAQPHPHQPKWKQTNKQTTKMKTNKQTNIISFELLLIFNSWLQRSYLQFPEKVKELVSVSKFICKNKQKQ